MREIREVSKGYNWIIILSTVSNIVKGYFLNYGFCRYRRPKYSFKLYSRKKTACTIKMHQQKEAVCTLFLSTYTVCCFRVFSKYIENIYDP